MFDVVYQSLQAHVLANWTSTPTNSIQFGNVAFNSDLFEEYVQFTVRFGDSQKRSLPAKCYRQIGLLIMTIKVRPGTGTNRKLALAREAAELYNNAVVHPIAPLIAPVVNFRETEFFDDDRERDGWVMAQVSVPFYYDWSS